LKRQKRISILEKHKKTKTMKNWHLILTNFYGVAESIKNFGYGFVTIFVGKTLIHEEMLRIIGAILSGLLVVWLFTKLLYSVFQLVINNSYSKDPSNYSESGIILNTRTKKCEEVNHLITVKERYSNAGYKDYLQRKYGLQFILMFFLGAMTGLIINV
jgi:hypothetical protein